MKPAFAKAIREHCTDENAPQPDKAGSGQSDYVGVAGLIGPQVVLQIGGGKNRALNSGCLNIG